MKERAPGKGALDKSMMGDGIGISVRIVDSIPVRMDRPEKKKAGHMGRSHRGPVQSRRSAVLIEGEDPNAGSGIIHRRIGVIRKISKPVG